MADFEFNISKGRTIEFHWRVNNNDPATARLSVVLLLAAGLEADGVLKDHNTLSALLAAANDEANFASYARQLFTDAELVDPTQDDTNDRQDVDIPDITWTAATAGTTVAKLLICYDPNAGGGDAAIVPMTAHDFNAVTDGTNLVAQVPTAGYFGAI